MNNELMKSLKDGAMLINESEKINIFPHIYADGDAIGSAFGIAFILKDLGKRVKIFLEEDPGDKLRFLLDDEIDYVITNGAEITEEPAQLSIINDCSDTKRVATRLPHAQKSGKILKIDHHVQIEHFGDVNFVDETWSATCEGMYMMATELGYDFTKGEHGKKAATALMTGLITDSGQFGYSNTTSYTHYVASELEKASGEVSEIARNMFEMKSFEKVKIFAKAYEHAEKFANGRAVFTYVTQEEIDETNAQHQDTDGISSSLCAVDGVEVSVLVKPSKQADKGWKASIRSFRYCDVAKIAANHAGGGHIRAAGCEINGTLEEVKKILIEEISREIEQ